jgi:hypothetical protein
MTRFARIEEIERRVAGSQVPQQIPISFPSDFLMVQPGPSYTRTRQDEGEEQPITREEAADLINSIPTESWEKRLEEKDQLQ